MYLFSLLYYVLLFFLCYVLKSGSPEIIRYQIVNVRYQISTWKEQSHSIFVLGSHSLSFAYPSLSLLFQVECTCLLHLQKRKFLEKTCPFWNCFCLTHPMQTYSLMQTLGALYKYYHLYFLFVFLRGVFGKICIMTWLIELCILLRVQMLWI